MTVDRSSSKPRLTCRHYIQIDKVSTVHLWFNCLLSYVIQQFFSIFYIGLNAIVVIPGDNVDKIYEKKKRNKKWEEKNSSSNSLYEQNETKMQKIMHSFSCSEISTNLRCQRWSSLSSLFTSTSFCLIRSCNKACLYIFKH